MKYESTKIIDLGSCAFRQWRAIHSHCKFIHGYRLLAKFWFACNSLDDKNWVVDFGELDELKKILQKQFDHTLCVAEDDPLLEGFKSLHTAGGCNLRIMQGVGIEKTSEWCLYTANNYIKTTTNNRCWVEKVEVWEHEKNSAIVSNTQEIDLNKLQVAVHTQPPVNQVRNFLQEVEQETGVQFSQTLKQIPGTQPTAPVQQGARFGSNVTKGYSNLFGGTSWGV
jgi:6-pyruvoyltetrahydropterin/6-carboxytetrahydropterin synthase